MLTVEKLLLTFLFLGALSCTQKGEVAKSNNCFPTTTNSIQIGQIETIYSKILDQDRKIIVYLPESAKDPNRKRDQYPVVYLLDGSDPFVPFVGMLQQYSEKNDTKILPEMIVVAIENINFNSRMMDFSPSTAGKPEVYGGGNKFLKFIRKELFPYIEENFAASQNRTIVGHSLGGLVAMNALTNHPEMFTNYLMIDGSLSFDDQIFLKNKEFSLKGKDLKNKNLFIAIANTATYGSDIESIKKDTISANKFVRYSLELVGQIEHMDTKLNMNWKYYEDDTHGSTAFLAQKDGFRFFYSWFNFKKEHNYRSKYFIPSDTNDRFAILTKEHFKNVSEKIGYEYVPNEKWVSSYAESLNSFQNQPEQAIETYKLNIEYYPKNPSVYMDLADFYLSQQDTVSAKKYYTKTLELEENFEAKEKLKILEI